MVGTQFKDYYATMGVTPEATPDQIKTAWRKLARQHHPDVSKEKDAQQRFSDLGEAHEVLSDPAKRKAYDEVRLGGWREGQEFPSANGYRQDDGQPFAADGEQFSDFFSSLFGARQGGRRSAHTAERGQDLRHAIELTLEEAYAGGERTLRLQMPNGAGADAGQVRTLRVTIPKGLADGEHIRLRGQGWPGATPELNGNLYLEVTLTPHVFYRVDGRDIELDLPLTPWEAVLGAQVPVPTLGGTTTVTIPPGSSDGQRLRLRGRGLPGTPPGDQYLTMRITVPPTADDKAKALWRDLAAASPYNPRQRLGV